MTDMDSSEKNRRTVEAYDAYAARYAAATEPSRSPTGSDALDGFIAAVGAQARVLEVASGPGWDANVMEARGLEVERTDVSDGFIAVQAERGKRVERLNLLSDDLGGPWDGIVALYVIQHIEKASAPDVVARIAAALRPGGTLLLSFQEGDEDFIEHGSDGGAYHIVRWPRDEMVALFGRHALEVGWERRDVDEEGVWITVLAHRS
ncbi:class I SAM-dependent methyltransferase [Brevundimonas sp.]|jgi:2-polyprenyl-3-methyl-5-hydroxy-6-metoxy-1,4-benzoquinol methylase|uniref:class I SAM-dependent methyltransferase n=1 Tax=Brevundimonas sp. TaxID=1871086 RepID=UPI002E113282|nr:methyltransferase domain-containing protein [Brevundimonas sp.]